MYFTKLHNFWFVFMQMVPACQNLYHNSFTYHCLKDDKSLQFDDAIQFIGMLFTFPLNSSVRYDVLVFFLSLC